MAEDVKALAEILRGHTRTLRLAGRDDGMVEDMERAAAALAEAALPDVPLGTTTTNLSPRDDVYWCSAPTCPVHQTGEEQRTEARQPVPAEPIGVVMTRVKDGQASKRPELYEAFKDLPNGTLLYSAPPAVEALDERIREAIDKWCGDKGMAARGLGLYDDICAALAAAREQQPSMGDEAAASQPPLSRSTESGSLPIGAAWVPLTDEQINTEIRSIDDFKFIAADSGRIIGATLHDFARAIERAHGITAAPGAAAAAGLPSLPESRTAKQRYDTYVVESEEPNPIERLRAFCSFAMSAQDWLDVEPFFDAVLGLPSLPAGDVEGEKP